AIPIRRTNARYLWMLARLRNGVTAKAAQGAVDSLVAQHQRETYGAMPASEYKRSLLAERIEVRDGAIGISFLREEFGEPLRVLLALVALLMLATCSNLAHLLLARGAARAKEIATRHALGASRARLIAQAMTETLLLALFGCALGAGVAVWGG